MASGAQLNRIGQRGGRVLLTTNLVTAIAVAAPNTAYGTIGVNDSGACMFEAIAFSKVVFQVLGTASIAGTATANGAFTIYGTLNQLAYSAFDEPSATGGGAAVGSTAVPAADWIPLPAPSTETAGDANAWANPILVGGFTGTTLPAYFNVAPMAAYRVVYTAAQAGLTGGLVQVVAFAVP